MKYSRLALLFLASTLTLVRAQQDEEKHAPPIEIPDFSNLDEYIYEPKSIVTLSFRHLSGAKATFSGGSSIPAPEGAIPLTGTNIARFYHDGSVLPDQRTVGRVDASGNPVIDPQNGSQVVDPIAPDGRTNSWSYVDKRQVTDAPNGYIAFHTYSAEVTDPVSHDKKSRASNGLDLAVSRDMGKIFKGKASWNLVAGMSVNDISANMSGYVPGTQTTITDLYSLYGAVPPDPPYTSPTSGTQIVYDAGGNPVVNPDGTTQSVSSDTSIAIGDTPSARTTKTTALAATSILNNWRVRGAYYTFRAGAELWIPITAHFRISMSLGPTILYSGTTYSVVETFTPDLGDAIVNATNEETNRILPGVYADATLQYDVTEKTGFFAGAIYQTAGGYTQTLNTAEKHYATKLDFANQNGIRAGMSIRF